jgi:ferritin-like metal-binding protein YciE
MSMASVESLREHLVEELNDLLNSEDQLLEALPKMAANTDRRELKNAFQSHLKETRGHRKRAAQALQMLKEEPTGKTCEAMKGLLEEGGELMDGADGGALRDAMMITAAQKVEHYEIASYGTVRTYALVLGEKGVARLMAQTLKEEKAADRKLTGIAEGSVNANAAKEWHANSGVLAVGAGWVGTTLSGAMKKIMRTQAADRSRSKSRRASNRSGAPRAKRSSGR